MPDLLERSVPRLVVQNHLTLHSTALCTLSDLDLDLDLDNGLRRSSMTVQQSYQTIGLKHNNASILVIIRHSLSNSRTVSLQTPVLSLLAKRCTFIVLFVLLTKLRSQQWAAVASAFSSRIDAHNTKCKYSQQGTKGG